ncbi:MAG: benzoate-CoA ligase family protein [Betaproteobacteria bacterium]|nr:benzoate-CoA ligase family protein [Betaproteobacteria bacterium]
MDLQDIGRDYNAAEDLVFGNLKAGRAGKPAYIDDAGQCTYGELADRVNRFGSHLLSLGLRMEDRILLAMHDTIDWPVAFLGAIKAGIVPIAVNTLLTPKDYEYMLSDSRARALLVSPPLWPQFEPFAAKLPLLKHILKPPFAEVIARADPELEPAPTTRDDACFWLYSSGSTGMPKGTVHVHSSMRLSAELYAKGVLGLGEADLCYSAAKLFFAYGLGNSLSFPLAAGATTVLMAERPTPEAVFKRLAGHKPTLFYGVPTLYAAMLASPAFPGKAELGLRQCISAGEALPPQISKSFKEKTGVEILDGIGSTEMLHIFLSNRPGELRYGTTGKAVPGYQLKLVDEQGGPVKPGELGELLIKGPTAANLYWNNRAKSRSTFVGEWTRSGDKYTQDADGFFVYGGRSDDMLKVSGIWVSPAELEAALVSHEAVLEAAVVGHEDEHKLVKPKAFVVLKPGRQATVLELQNYLKSSLAPYKYPRWIEFATELPKTATGKIQRFKLRG